MKNNFLKKIYKVIFPDFDFYLKRELAGCNSVLDLGCGPDSLLRLCRVKYSVGVDLTDSYIQMSKVKKIHNKYILKDIMSVSFDEKSFDAVIMIDVIEHLSKDDGFILLERAKKWARKKIVILTPNGFVPQYSQSSENYADKKDNVLQEHQSGWTVNDFDSLGFKVWGINGIKWLRKDHAALIFKPVLFWIIISNITQKIAYYLPKTAFHLFAVKDFSEL